MIREEIGTGRTVEAAIANGAEKLGVDASRIEYEIIEAPKKGFLGFGEAPAKVRVFVEIGPEQTAVDYINNVMRVMGIENARASIARELNSEGGKIVKVEGEEAGILIGRHGETLDSIQYLSNLALNAELERNGSECAKVTVDIEGYRARREETLRNLAKRSKTSLSRHSFSAASSEMICAKNRLTFSWECRYGTTSAIRAAELVMFTHNNCSMQ